MMALGIQAPPSGNPLEGNVLLCQVRPHGQFLDMSGRACLHCLRGMRGEVSGPVRSL